MRDEDETTLVQTLTSEPSLPQELNLSFDWRVDLSDGAQARIRQKVHDVLAEEQELGPPPVVVTITRPVPRRTDRSVHADVKDRSGKRLCLVSIGNNGLGSAYCIL